MWLACLLILLVVLAVTWWRAGPHRAIGVTVLLSLLVPSWVTYEILGFPIGIQIASAIAALGAYCLHPQAVFRVRLGVVDWAMIGMIAIHSCIDWSYQGFSWSVLMRAYGEWFVPYVAGRLAIRNADDIRALLPLMVTIVILFAVTATVQGLTGVDLAETVFGRGDVDRNVHGVLRWGIHRAFGPLKNPNYFGVLQLLLFPWSVYAAARAWNYGGPWWWLFLPVISAAGVFFPMSRAAQGGLVVSGLLAWLLTRKHWRMVIPLLAATIVVCIAWQSESTMNLLDAWSGDLRGWSNSRRTKPQTIKIDNEERRVTVTSARVHVIELYRVAMRKAGLFGFGTEAVTGFPVNVPVGQQDLDTLKRIWTVDNSFLLMGLRFGYLGLICFAVWCVGIAAIWVRMTVWGDPTTPGFKAFPATMAGVSIAMLVVLLTVWMPQDFGFWYVWIGGAASGLNEGLLRVNLSRQSTSWHRSLTKAARCL